MTEITTKLDKAKELLESIEIEEKNISNIKRHIKKDAQVGGIEFKLNGYTTFGVTKKFSSKYSTKILKWLLVDANEFKKEFEIELSNMFK